jgi:hypothetical protein
MSNSHTPVCESAPTFGPASAFQIEGRVLRFGTNENEVAVYRNGKWVCRSGTFTVLESETPVVVRFEDERVWRPSVHGPFTSLQIANGAIRHGPGFVRVLAEFDEPTESWMVGVDGESYACVVLARPPQPQRRGMPLAPAGLDLPAEACS